MIRTAIISVIGSFVLFGAWTVNLVSYHPTTDLNPLAPFSVHIDRPGSDVRFGPVADILASSIPLRVQIAPMDKAAFSRGTA